MIGKKIKVFMENSYVFKRSIHYLDILTLTVITYGLITKSNRNIWFTLFFLFNLIFGILYMYIFFSDIDIRYNENDDWDEYKKKILRKGLLNCFVVIVFFIKMFITVK